MKWGFYFEYGNGVTSSYIYNTATRRLQTLTTTATNGSLHNITYTYDPVGNITNITNAATGADGLGGSFTYNYSYDDLYRLDSSDGSGSIDASYTLAMAYSPSGNILKKTLAASTEILGNAGSVIYDNEYTYSGAHTLQQLFEVNGLTPDLQFGFDANGNMTSQQMYSESLGGLNERSLCWDEENRLSATRDNNYVTANIYDASGNRAWKLAGEMNWMWQNGVGWQGYGDLNLRTWYQSELVTITDVGFTKHYFIAGQKIASKLGEGLINSDDLYPLKGDPIKPIHSEYTELARAQSERIQRDFDCFGLSYGNFNPGETYFEMLEAYEGIEIGEESSVYFYHSDHLGSSSFLTDGGGVATQHLQYMPFGEDLVHQQNTAAYYTPYTFSGKERDMETGLSYFGARYYDAGLSIWLSVDPMSDKYPSLSAYNYCAWNPVMLVDPDGRDIWEIDEGGKVVNRIEDKTKDEFHKVDADGNRIEGACETFEYGTVKSEYQKDIKVRNSQGELEQQCMTIFEVNRDENATKLFEFFAGSETVEWTHAKIGTKNSGRNVVGTSNQPSSTPVGHHLRTTGYTLREVNHNHPGRTFPSQGDINNASLYEANGKNIPLNVFVSGYGYIPYNSSSTYQPRRIPKFQQ